MNIPILLSSTTQFPTIRGRTTHHRHRAGLILPSSSSISISTSKKPPLRDAGSLRPTSLVVSSSRKATKIVGRRVSLVGGNVSPSSGYDGLYDGFGNIGSCGGDAVIVTDGGDGVPPSCGGGGGGGRGGEEESSNAGGGGDWDLPLLVRILTKLQLAENDPRLGSNDMALKSFRLLADYIGRLLRFLISTPEGGAVLSFVGVVVEDNSQCPSPYNSSSSMSTCTMSPMRIEGRHSGDNCDVESRSRSVWSRLVQFVNDLRSYRGSRTEPVVSPVRNPAVNKTKGLLGSFYTIAEKLFIFCGGLVIWSFQYPLGAHARQSFDDLGMQGIIIASVISFFLSWILAPLASYTKEAESIYGAAMKIFKWLFLVLSLGLWAELCAILRFCADTQTSILWPFGIVGFVSIVLIWAWVFYVEVRQEQMDSLRQESMMLLANPESEPASTILSLPPV